MPDQPCYYTDSTTFDMGADTLTLSQWQHAIVLGGSAFIVDGRVLHNDGVRRLERGDAGGGQMADSPAHETAFHDSLPAASVSAGAFYRHAPVALLKLDGWWRAFNEHKYVFEKVMAILVPRCRDVRRGVTWAQLQKLLGETAICMERPSKQLNISSAVQHDAAEREYVGVLDVFDLN
jgi:hypothetical protein